MKKLTKMQQKVYDYIAQFSDQVGLSALCARDLRRAEFQVPVHRAFPYPESGEKGLSGA